MDDYWCKRVKKLALSYETGWQFTHGGQEAGSVIADIFLEMMAENRRNYGRLWEKQQAEFLQVTPKAEKERALLRCGICIPNDAEVEGGWLPAGTEVFGFSEKGAFFQFETKCGLQVANAALSHVLYEKNGIPRLVYNGGKQQDGIPLFRGEGERLAAPFYEWSYENLCNGLSKVRFRIEFYRKDKDAMQELKKGCAEQELQWSVTDGSHTYFLAWEEKEGLHLFGDTGAFAENRDTTAYGIRLSVGGRDGVTSALRAVLHGGFMIREEQKEWEPDIFLTQEGGSREESVDPFGRNPEEGLCLYIACDGAMGRAHREITMSYREEYRIEERLPGKKDRKYEKAVKRYPWLAASSEAYEWKISETVWEYFNGNVWCVIPAGASWKTCCGKEAVVRRNRFVRPKDMKACVVDGEEHFYIRLRAVRAEHAYAMYYRKYIPVLKNVRFLIRQTDKKSMEVKQNSMPEAGGERMYFGFDGEVTEKTVFLGQIKEEATGECVLRQFSPKREQLCGRREYYGIDAWWVVLNKKPDRELTLTGLWPNYVEILQKREEGGADTEEEIMPEVFSVKTKAGSAVRAIPVEDVRYENVGAPYRDTIENAGHFFRHFNRLLTAEDVCLFCRERYPFLKSVSCYMEDDGNTLVLAIQEEDVQRAEDNAGQSRADGLPAVLAEWLETELKKNGNLWICCRRVKVKLMKGGERDA